jgi:hypothetical protein
MATPGALPRLTIFSPVERTLGFIAAGLFLLGLFLTLLH